ncbi:rhodanese-like domain-containing protein [Leptolyngbya sp. KIOST-1]|uniref:rhodanese-like domain-containing protein n=1 Tax=Leptolyngbya sp. KIOST-1 TaxID=1229172 RepID=UPI000691017C|nr:rhodanese-like domain-containing protein [Leptolyngbya sp. KIOST-1]
MPVLSTFPPRLWAAARPVAWWGIKHWIQRSFPEVSSLTPQNLDHWLSQGNAPIPILLDVRRDDEFAVSHLPGAYSAPDLKAALALDLARDRPIVAYCSVGYRSARLAAQLKAAGYTQVYNLAGSLFQWANDGRSLVQAGQPTSVVHPYNRCWGLLLRPGLAALPHSPPAAEE